MVGLYIGGFRELAMASNALCYTPYGVCVFFSAEKKVFRNRFFFPEV
jgi:hypothetical protein